MVLTTRSVITQVGSLEATRPLQNPPFLFSGRQLQRMREKKKDGFLAYKTADSECVPYKLVYTDGKQEELFDAPTFIAC